ncbi:hypothetical protein A2Z67_05255 [Candidatus Woesebacteria bacterium RBG_13_36_22]|uniref:Uncharacterized protein n=1 Tax=Candidatus Woesebacteria bacterium RBG_13_36_22 TaxID=1802478 RepID=A0A1F7X2J8_9BACT|nr:MAG: hypothetical protein A2Z67_05255 [Candidatus Woesebacteria bacterium RBG_13_36_22]
MMIDLSGKEKCTLIETMTGESVVVKPGFKQEFESLADALRFISGKGWEVNINFIKGSPVMREIQKGSGNGICKMQEKAGT